MPEDILTRIQEDQERSHQTVRAMLSGDALAEYDAQMEEITSGRYALSMLWHSLTPAQREALRELKLRGGRFVISDRPTSYDHVSADGRVVGTVRFKTIRTLVRHFVLHFTVDDASIAELAPRGETLFDYLDGLSR